ncbi:hypothetical protein AAG906_029043 [Vitis piasezkii]
MSEEDIPCKSPNEPRPNPIPNPNPNSNPNPSPNPNPDISNDDENNNSINTCESLGTAISSMLGSVIRDFDSRADAVIRSQDHLSLVIDRLTGELDKLLEDAPLPFIMQHAAKISGVRKRVSSLNSLLKSIQRRVDNIDGMLSMGLAHEKTITASSGHY